MARKLTPEETQERKGRPKLSKPSKYPWDEWLDGDHWVLEQGEDFPDVKFNSIRKLAKAAAEVRGKTCTTTKLGPTTLVIYATPKEG